MKRLFKLFLVSFVALTGIFLSGCAAPQVQTLRESASPVRSSTVVTTSVVEITKNGFKPSAINVSVGETVIFKNYDDAPHQVAADPHPTHDVLPHLFSAQIYKNRSYRFVFDQQGSFGVHLEDNPSVLAKIIVK